jgi:hypothetical protein
VDGLRMRRLGTLRAGAPEIDMLLYVYHILPGLELPPNDEAWHKLVFYMPKKKVSACLFGWWLMVTLYLGTPHHIFIL